MKERLPRKQKKQSRLVSKWLAAHPEYRPIEPHINRLNIQTCYVQPQKFYTKISFHKIRHDSYQNEEDWNRYIRKELAYAFLDVVSNSIRVEKKSQDDQVMEYVATLELIPYCIPKQEIDEMYERQERDAFAEFNHMLQKKARDKEIDMKVRMIRAK